MVSRRKDKLQQYYICRNIITDSAGLPSHYHTKCADILPVFEISRNNTKGSADLPRHYDTQHIHIYCLCLRELLFALLQEIIHLNVVNCNLTICVLILVYG